VGTHASSARVVAPVYLCRATVGGSGDRGRVDGLGPAFAPTPHGHRASAARLERGSSVGLIHRRWSVSAGAGGRGPLDASQCRIAVAWALGVWHICLYCLSELDHQRPFGSPLDSSSRNPFGSASGWSGNCFSESAAVESRHSPTA